jgi:hypothetical protein
MGMVALEQRIASAYTVFAGPHGAVCRLARQRGVSRQCVYREAHGVEQAIEQSDWQSEKQNLQQRVAELERHNQQLQKRLAQAVVIDAAKQAELASVGQAIGVSLSTMRTLLEVLQGDAAPSVATLGRWTKAAGQKATALLKVFDRHTDRCVQEVVADEIFVRDPVMMVVEPESLCWLKSRLLKRKELTGSAWRQEWASLPELKQVTADAGRALQRGVADINAQRQSSGITAVVEQLDHFHVLQHGGCAVAGLEKQARGLLLAATKRYVAWQRRRQRGQRMLRWDWVLSARGRAARAINEWVEHADIWEKVKQALRLVTPEGVLNTRARAEAILAKTLPALPEKFSRSKRLLKQERTLTYLDRVHSELQALKIPDELRQAAIRQETLRRCPELLRQANPQAAALRGVLLVCAAILHQAGAAGEEAVRAVQAIFRNARRASSLVECINSVLRMQQQRHRRMSQGLLNLKRLYWNCHRFRTGRRRGKSPYELLGLPWPAPQRWWELLTWSPEQLTEKLSASPVAA